jgi:hypothetical protein
MLTEALAAQKYTRKFFVVELDFHEATIEALEAQCEAAKWALRAGLSPENIDKLTGLWGAYFGEVLRRHSTAQWATISVDGIDRHVLQTAGHTVSPHDIVRQRLEQGPSADLRAAYATIKAQLQG